MTERERWIVYPLLFLALGAAPRQARRPHDDQKHRLPGADDRRRRAGRTASIRTCLAKIGRTEAEPRRGRRSDI